MVAKHHFFKFSRTLGGVVEFVILSKQITPSACAHALRDAQNMCAVTKGGTVHKSLKA